MSSNLRYAITILSLGIMGTTQAQQHHFYLQIKGKQTNNHSYEYDIGRVTHTEKNKIQFSSYDEKNLDIYADLLSDSISTLSDDYDLTLYIHGMWANQPHIWKASAQNLVNEVIVKNDKPQIIVSIIWDAGIIYKKSVAIAKNKGEALQGFLIPFLRKQKHAGDINLIAHSMGNRVFQHAIQNQLKTKNQVITRYVSLGADLEADIFECQQPLENISNLCKNTLIYIHNNDRTLKVSKILNNNDRLGLVGVKKDLLESSSSPFKVIDVSLVVDNEGFGGKFSNHRYYYTSPLVRSDLKAWLSDAQSIERQQSKIKNIFYLDPDLSKE